MSEVLRVFLEAWGELELPLSEVCLWKSLLGEYVREERFQRT